MPRYFVAFVFGFVGFLLAFALGTALTLGTGVPLLGGLANGVIVAGVLTVGVLATNRFGSATVMWLALSAFAIPTTTLGPQGAYKVVLGLAAGLTWDIIYFASRRRVAGLIGGAVVGALLIMGLLMEALRLGYGRAAQAALEKYSSYLVALLVINIVVTTVGVVLGRYVYIRRLSHLQVFQRYQDEDRLASHADV